MLKYSEIACDSPHKNEHICSDCNRNVPQRLAGFYDWDNVWKPVEKKSKIRFKVKKFSCDGFLSK